MRQAPDALRFHVLASEIEPLLAHASRARGAAARRWAIDLLEHGLSLADPGTVDDAQRSRALVLGADRELVASTARSAPMHAVRVPLYDAASDRALVRTFFASFDAAPATGPALVRASETAVHEAFELARHLAADPRVRAIRWVAAQPRALEHVEVTGDSLGAGALVSAMALLTGRSVRPGIAVTGALRGETLTAVGSMAPKLTAVRRAGLRVLLAPPPAPVRRTGRTSLQLVRTIDELLRAALDGSHEVRDVEALVREARDQVSRGWRGFRWPEALELLERAIAMVPEGDTETRVELLARLGAAERHAGSLRRSQSVLDLSEKVAASAAGRAGVTDATRSLVHQQQAMTLLRCGELGSAARAARAAWRAAARARSRREQVKALGVTGWVAQGRGDDDAASKAFAQALVLDRMVRPHHAARSLAYLLESEARGGRLALARRHFALALTEVQLRASRSDEAWVRAAFGAGLTAAGKHRDALEVLDVPVVHDAMARDPLPGLRARRHLGEALLVAGDASQRERGQSLLLSAVSAHGRILEPGLRQYAGLCLLVAVQRGAGEDRALATGLACFTEGALADAAEAIARRPPGRARSAALSRLIARLDRLP